MTKDEKKVSPKTTKNQKVTKKDTKKKEKKVKNKAPKESYFKGVNKELKLVKWPTAKEVLKYTLSTIILCVILCGVFMFLNLILSIIKGWFV